MVMRNPSWKKVLKAEMAMSAHSDSSKRFMPRVSFSALMSSKRESSNARFAMARFCRSSSPGSATTTPDVAMPASAPPKDWPPPYTRSDDEDEEEDAEDEDEDGVAEGVGREGEKDVDVDEGKVFVERGVDARDEGWLEE